MPIVILIVVLFVSCLSLVYFVDERKKTGIILISFFIIAISLWMFFASKVDFEYKSKTYKIKTIDNIQVIVVGNKFVNMNYKLKRCFTDSEEIEVSKPISEFAGGIYWMGEYTKYKVVKNKGNKNKK
jgi:hypothetical protein